MGALALNPDEIGPTTPISTETAAALAFPDGSVTPLDLRRAFKSGWLGGAYIGGKIFTSLAEVECWERPVIPTPSAGKGIVYFIGYRDYVKIGFTRSPAGFQKRLLTLQTGAPEPLKLLVAVVGTRGDEAALHRRFARLRLSGEWFSLEAELRHHIGLLKRGKL